MSSPLAIIGLTFDGTDIQDLHGLFLELVAGLGDSPAVRGTDVTVPGAAGQQARPRVFHERRPLLAGFVRGDGATEDDRRSDYRDNVTALLTLFDATAAPAALVATLENGATATIEARTLNLETVEVEPGEESRVSITMLAVEDWVYT